MMRNMHAHPALHRKGADFSEFSFTKGNKKKDEMKKKIINMGNILILEQHMLKLKKTFCLDLKCFSNFRCFTYFNLFSVKGDK